MFIADFFKYFPLFRFEVGEVVVSINMGVSGKWIKALIGLKKQDKAQRSGEDGHVSILITLLSYIICMFLLTRFLVSKETYMVGS